MPPSTGNQSNCLQPCLHVSAERGQVPRRSQLADVILSVGDQQVPAHSCVLCVWSEVFKALLTRWSAQRTGDGTKAAAVTVDLSQGDSPEDFLELLHFCYVGTCQVSGCSARPSGCQGVHLHEYMAKVQAALLTGMLLDFSSILASYRLLDRSDMQSDKRCCSAA